MSTATTDAFFGAADELEHCERAVARARGTHRNLVDMLMRERAAVRAEFERKGTP
jgi:hypothetical protein